MIKSRSKNATSPMRLRCQLTLFSPSFGSHSVLLWLCRLLQLHWRSDTSLMLQYDTTKVTVFRLLEKQNELWNAFVSLWVLEIWRPYLEQETQAWNLFLVWCIGCDSDLIRGFKVLKADRCSEFALDMPVTGITYKLIVRYHICLWKSHLCWTELNCWRK